MSGFGLLVGESTLRLLEGLDSAVSVDSLVGLCLGVRGLWSCCCGLLVGGEFGVGLITARYCLLLSSTIVRVVLGCLGEIQSQWGILPLSRAVISLKDFGIWSISDALYLTPYNIRKILYSKGLRPYLQMCTTHPC